MLRIVASFVALLALYSPLPAEIGASSLPAHFAFESSPNSALLSFRAPAGQLSNPIYDGSDYSSLALAGEGSTYERGEPMLPAVSRFIVVPSRAGLRLSVDPGEATRVLPTEQVLICEDSEIAVSDASSGDYYPASVAEMSEPVVIRGVRLVKVTIYPVQYDRSSGEYLVRSSIDARVEFTDAEPVNPASQPSRRNRSAEFLKFIRAVALNGDEVGRDDPEGFIPYAGHYLVVANRNALLWHAPFIEWRRKAGYKVDIIGLSGNDSRSAATVRNRIQQLYDAYLEAGEDPFDQILLIGDRESYDTPGQNVANVLQAEVGSSTFHGARHADYKYALLEGDDQIPDVAFSRFPSGGEEVAHLVTARTLAYEATPRMQNPAWFNTAGVFSQHWGNQENSAWHPSIHTNVRWGFEALQYRGFNPIRWYENFNWDQVGDNIGPELADWFNDGANLLVGRAENYHWRQNFTGVRANTVFPIFICNSGHGDWTGYVMFRSGSANNLRGPVLNTFGWGVPPTATSNYIWLKTVSGVVSRDMTLGWARNFALVGLEATFPNFNTESMNRPIYLASKTDFDMNGDPGIQPWIGTPRILEAEFPEAIAPGTKSIEVVVHERDDGMPVEGARVSLYAPGSIPMDNATSYGNYTDLLQISLLTDATGSALFVLEGVELTAGTHLYLTVTGRDIRPIFSDLTITAPQAGIDIDDFTLTEMEGNDDGEPNPGEEFDLRIRAKNIGAGESVHSVEATIESLSGWVSAEEETLRFGDIAPGRTAESDASIRITFSPTTPDGAAHPSLKPILKVLFTAGDARWESALTLNPLAPCYRLESFDPDGALATGEQQFDIEIRNVGSTRGGELQGELISLGQGVAIVEHRAAFPAVEPGETTRIAGDLFRVYGDIRAIPGLKTPMQLLLTDESGFIDSCRFSVQVGEARSSSPLGPDGYGYVCYDDTDTLWAQAPDYDWIEINPNDQNPDFEGRRLDFSGRSQHNIGECRAVPLPFDVQFYGERFDTLSIALNGFVSLGGQPVIVNFQNWRMDEAIGGGAGMIAALWDDLRLAANVSGVYYYHDEEDDRFIVEWNRMRGSSGNTEHTFQIILFDPEARPTPTGDAGILIQYKAIAAARNIRNNDNEWSDDIPFASVGISSPDGVTGLNYCFNNVYHRAAAGLQAHRALFFTTETLSKVGSLRGRVTDAADGSPVAGATIRPTNAPPAQSDPEGFWFIPSALADVRFAITASLPGYNDSTLTGQSVAEHETLELNFALLHPEFCIDLDSLSYLLAADSSVREEVAIGNSGNGRLSFTITCRYNDNSGRGGWLGWSPGEGSIDPAGEAEIRLEVDPVALPGGVYSAQLRIAHNAADGMFTLPIRLELEPDLAQDEPDAGLPDQFDLKPLHPNPFNAMTQVAFDLPFEAPVEIVAFDLSGRRIATLASGSFEAGRRRLEWDAASVAPGIYLVRMDAPGFRAVKKAMLIK